MSELHTTSAGSGLLPRSSTPSSSGRISWQQPTAVQVVRGGSSDSARPTFPGPQPVELLDLRESLFEILLGRREKLRLSALRGEEVVLRLCPRDRGIVGDPACVREDLALGQPPRFRRSSSRANPLTMYSRSRCVAQIRNWVPRWDLTR